MWVLSLFKYYGNEWSLGTRIELFLKSALDVRRIANSINEQIIIKYLFGFIGKID